MYYFLFVSIFLCWIFEMYFFLKMLKYTQLYIYCIILVPYFTGHKSPTSKIDIWSNFKSPNTKSNRIEINEIDFSLLKHDLELYLQI